MRTDLIKKILLFLAIAITTACEAEKVVPPKTNPVQLPTKLRDPESYDSLTPRGVIVPLLRSVPDTNQTYTLFLPPGFNVRKSWPVIFFFDPQAKPVVPIEKYKSLAIKYGYILAGSNHTRNGQTLGYASYVFPTILK